MSNLSLKQEAAKKALEYIQPNSKLGVGTGSTVDCLIELLPLVRDKITNIVSSSIRSTEKLEALGFKVEELKDCPLLDLYIDGADEVNPQLEMIKGGGAALTREKIVAACAKEFICIADESKAVDILGEFPLPIEIIPMALPLVLRELEILGGKAQLREGVITDNGNLIIDVFGTRIIEPKQMEMALNQITGVVTNGIFALRKADKLILATSNGIKVFE